MNRNSLSRIAAVVAVGISCFTASGIATASTTPPPDNAASPTVSTNPPGVNPNLLGTYTATLTVKVNYCSGLFGTTTGQLTLNGDGTWTSTGFSGGDTNLGGSWLERGNIIALSDMTGTAECGTNDGGTYMAKVTQDTTSGKYLFGTATQPGILNAPWNWNGKWYASQN